jgi:hypothetical protein
MADIDQDAYTKPFMLTKSMHRDVYPDVSPLNNSVAGQVVIITGAAGGLGYVSKPFLHIMIERVKLTWENYQLGYRACMERRRGQRNRARGSQCRKSGSHGG